MFPSLLTIASYFGWTIFESKTFAPRIPSPPIEPAKPPRKLNRAERRAMQFKGPKARSLR